MYTASILSDVYNKLRYVSVNRYTYIFFYHQTLILLIIVPFNMLVYNSITHDRSLRMGGGWGGGELVDKKTLRNIQSTILSLSKTP